MTQVKMYDFNENPIANLNDEKIIQKSYEKLPVIGQNSNFKNGSSLFFSDSTNNILDPFETSSQNFTNSSSNLYSFSFSLNLSSTVHNNIDNFEFIRKHNLSRNKEDNLFSNNLLKNTISSLNKC
jgi:hypothetical protein